LKRFGHFLIQSGSLGRDYFAARTRIVSVILKLAGVSKTAFRAMLDVLWNFETVSFYPATFASLSLQAVVDFAAAAGPAGHDIRHFDK
jgi:hypothetical protein